MADRSDAASPPVFASEFSDRFRDLVLWRRDVRRFRTDALPEGAVERLIELACRAPSVGNCQPWRFVFVETAERRDVVKSAFKRANERALAGYEGERHALYASLKLEGLGCAPVQLAVFADEATDRGAGLGRQTMPETLHYSVVGAVHTLWLAARAQGIGVGWVSILDPQEVTRALDVPEAWKLVAYLCLGWPVEEHLDPELERAGWERRTEAAGLVVRR
ncbi:cob(II)yrinic acid a,c-diamide reductase [Hyphomicrobium nitrativorans NL23]|uniref:Cob(II)yrinic acid a,c-diamide reductase n=1 Tax=Hyphomicrobium nitrativorans NL23 TaxID=1029756 RepID=V5SGN8_9HYPH|nr:5,6-dimethylbenzimidazole synthase [Hyphomicrobium nitrativorans]AHB49119.1 cob(II)yrinic acid a,c-diamide reductase [Hyphomicrobium nitrativorans NL23]